MNNTETVPTVGDKIFVPSIDQSKPIDHKFGGYNAGYGTIEKIEPEFKNARHQHCVWVRIQNYPDLIPFLWEGFLASLQKSMKGSSIDDVPAQYHEDFFVQTC